MQRSAFRLPFIGNDHCAVYNGAALVLRRLFLRGPGMAVQSPQVPADAKSHWYFESDTRSGAVFCFDALVCFRRHLQPFDLQMRLTLWRQKQTEMQIPPKYLEQEG